MEKLFTTAEAEAERAGVTKPGAEYLVISALQLPEGSARRAFERVGADPEAFRDAVGGRHEDAPLPIGIDSIDGHPDQRLPEPARSHRPVQYGTSGRELFQSVVSLVRREKSQIYGASIVFVAAQIDHGTTPRALQRMNVDRSELAAAARAELDLLAEYRARSTDD